MSSRNPFRIRTFQRTAGDDQFVRLFAPSALDVIGEVEQLWESVQYLRSAPGGGKTSLLRLMTPGPLRTLRTLLRGDSRLKEAATRLEGLGALVAGRSAILGVMLSFSNDYRDLAGADPKALQVFRALLTARIVLAALRAVVDHCGLSYPDDLAKIEAIWRPIDGATVPAKADGARLQAWASDIEEGAYEVLDAFASDETEATRGMIGFDGLQWLAGVSFSADGAPIEARPVLLLDELQLLTPAQRASLNEAVTALRKSLGIWVAERLEALNPQDLLAVGVKSGRDYTADIRLEDFWRNRQGPLKRFLGEIADLRVDQADGFQGRTFFSLLAPQLLDVEWRKKFEAYALRLETEFAGTNTSSARYSDWIETTRRADEEGLGRAIAWRRLGIMIERDRGKDQPSFDFEMLPAERLTGSTTAQISEAAELMVVKDLQAPFYYGPDRIAQLSSANVDQFLALSGDLFEEILSAKLLRRPELQLSAVRQHELVKAAAKRLWRDIPRGSARGHAVLRFLEALAHVCVNETHRATAPYAPGVTGIGITMNDRDMLAEGGGSAHAFAELREVIATCVAHNLLEPKLDLMNKGQRWLVLYLNRMLCAHHDLPLGYGGWRPQKLPALAKWIAAGSASVQEDKLV